MLKLKEFLQEEVNAHLEHIDDLPFNEGVDGLRKAINFLRDLRDMLAGHSIGKVSTSVKFDGAPAIFAGIDPRDGKFFVAKKGIFNKNPVVYKTPAEIDADAGGDLAVKLKIALQEFKKLGITGIYQGDIMFTRDTLRKENISGESYITFHPNTIIYAVPTGTPAAQKLLAAKIGVVWHTTYTGNSFEDLRASFSKTIVDKLNDISSVWQMDATYQDYSGLATFTKQETAEVTAVLSLAGALFRTIDAKALNDIRKNPDFLMLVKTFNNSKIRVGQEVTNTQAHVTELFHWIWDRLQLDIDSKKTEKGKQNGEAKRDAIMTWFKTYDKSELVKIYDIINLMIKAKHMIINKMNQASNINTFIKTANGFRITDAEGYVCIDHLAGGAVKLVNRMEFSRSNFDPTILKGWNR